MKIRLCLIILLLFLFLVKPSLTFAQDEYILPYPGFMPGNPLYKISQAVDSLQEWWSFGNFAKFSYNLAMADKKLVEAKTLFEYKQYLLAYEALQKSNFYFKKTLPNLLSAQQEGKNISEKSALLKRAASRHKNILEQLLITVPENFSWQPENARDTILPLREGIQASITIRNNMSL